MSFVYFRWLKIYLMDVVGSSMPSLCQRSSRENHCLLDTGWCILGFVCEILDVFAHSDLGHDKVNKLKLDICKWEKID